MCKPLAHVFLGMFALCAFLPSAQGAPSLALETIVQDGLRQPLFLTHAGDGSGRLFVVEQEGRVRIVHDGKVQAAPFLDIAADVLAGGERGLLGLAFHPRYRDNGRLFLNYTRKPDGATVIAEYKLSGNNADRAATRGQVLLVVAQPWPNHNGGMLAFGPDGYLYIGMGDGGLAGDPGNRAQNPQELLGKMLRIDVDSGKPKPYGIPPDNPYAHGGGRPEIYAIGLRNPWRFSFDKATGGLWAGDVGQGDREEIDIIRRGANYGWRIMEGTQCFLPFLNCSKKGLELPVTEYKNARPRCAVTGGYVYRGKALAELQGYYLFADFCSGEVLGYADGKQQILLDTEFNIASFGEDEAGEMYVVDLGGRIGKIIRTVPAAGQ